MINFDTQKASRSFKILCVAILFKYFDITINSINLLPDTVGCLLFIAGLGGLSHIHDSFVKARICATALTFVSLFESVTWSDIPLAQEKVLAWTENAFVYQVAFGSVLNIILVWQIFAGILTPTCPFVALPRQTIISNRG